MNSCIRNLWRRMFGMELEEKAKANGYEEEDLEDLIEEVLEDYFIGPFPGKEIRSKGYEDSFDSAYKQLEKKLEIKPR